MSARALGLVVTTVALAACHDFDSAVDTCRDAGICQDVANGGGTSGAGGNAMGGGPGGGGSSATGGGSAGSYGVATNPSNLSAAPGTSAASQVFVTYPSGQVPDFLVRLTATDGGRGDVTTFIPNGGEIFGTATATIIVTPDFPLDAGTRDLVLQLFLLDGGLAASTPVAMTVRAPGATLLVDDDGRGANVVDQTGELLSVEDLVFEVALRARGVAVDRFIMPNPPTGTELTMALAGQYASMVWYTGGTFGSATSITPADETLIEQYVDTGRNVVLVSEGFLYSYNDTWTQTTDMFVSNYLGAVGAAYDEDHSKRVFTGASGTSAAGVAVAYANTDWQVGYLNPKSDTTVLLTETTPDSGMPVATVHTTGAGAHVVFCGFGMVDVGGTDADAGRAAVLDVLFKAALIPN